MRSKMQRLGFGGRSEDFPDLTAAAIARPRLKHKVETDCAKPQITLYNIPQQAQKSFQFIISGVVAATITTS